MNFKEKFKVVLFDMDGVLVKSEHLYHEAKLATLKNHSIQLTHADLDPYQGQTDLAFFREIKKQFLHLKPTAHDLALESEALFKTELSHKMEPEPGVQDFIRKIHHMGVRIANVTSATAESQKTALKMLGVTDCFEVLVNSNTVTNYKPHPEPYLSALKQLRPDLPSCLVIEDTVSGIRSAKAAGLTVLAFGNTFPKATLMNAGADFYAESYAELSKAWN